MKKILFSCAAAICLVIGLSAFQGKQTSYYWFDTGNEGQLVMSHAQDPTTYSGVQSSTPPCAGGTKYCELGFLAGQLNFAGGIPESVKSGEQGVNSNEN
jgi:hypothetical protein